MSLAVCDRIGGAMRRIRVVVLMVALGVAATGAVLVIEVRAATARTARELNTVGSLLARAARPQTASAQRRELAERAVTRALAARRRLDDWPIRPLAAVPVLGRDLRAVRAITDAAAGTARTSGRVAAALEAVERHPGPGSLRATAAALDELGRGLRDGAVRVRRSRTLLADTAKERFLRQAGPAERAATNAGRGLETLAALYGPPGSARYFLAFQNPAELRGTGGLIGQYGILEAGPAGPVVREVRPLRPLRTRLRGNVPPPSGFAGRYRRLGVTEDWRSVNIPPDLPTVGNLIVAMYRRSTGEHLDGVIVVDPFALARVLRVSGPITVDGVRLSPRKVVRTLLLDAYLRYPTDKDARRRFLSRVGLEAADATIRAITAEPAALFRSLAASVRGRHLAVFATDPTTERALVELGIGGSAAAPPLGDYLMPVGVNAAANKIDNFMRRRVRYTVRLQPDGGARAAASVTLRNTAPPDGLPRYLIGPFDRRFEAGENRTLLSVYVAGAYGFSRATRDGRPVRVVTDEELNGLALTQDVSIAAGRSTTLAYDLFRHAAVQAEEDGLHYRLLLRPQATVHPDRLDVAVTAPPGWYFAERPRGFTGNRSTVRWSGALNRERSLDFLLAPVEK
jgi:hypothetical protein